MRLALALALTACTPAPNSNGAATQTAADTLAGVVTEVGSMPATSVSLMPAAGGRAITLYGEGAAGLTSVSGARVWVSGHRVTDAFHVQRFVVREVNGQPVDDGVVVRAGAGYELQLTSGGRRAVVNPPQALSEHVGARIWITRPPPDRVASFGVIR